MSKSTQQRAELHPEGFSGELRLIPLWSVAGAVVAFTLMEYLMWVVVAAHRHHPPNLPFGFRFYVNISIGALAAIEPEMRLQRLRDLKADGETGVE